MKIAPKKFAVTLVAGVLVGVPAGLAHAATISCSGGTCFGTSAADTMIGTNGHDEIYGYEGNDEISGYDLADRIGGQAGNDSVFGNAGNDRYATTDGEPLGVGGGPGNDQLSGGPGNDYVIGGPGEDILHGRELNDILFSDTPDFDRDQLFGDDGYDICVYIINNDVSSGCEEIYVSYEV